MDTVKIRRREFAIIGNKLLQDPELSLKAKGLAALMASLPQNWAFSTRGIAIMCKESHNTISAAIKELVERGYCESKQKRDEKGRIVGWDYIIDDAPEKGEPRPKNPRPKNWDMDKERSKEINLETKTQETKKDKTDKTDRSAKRARLGLPAYTHGYTMHLIEKGSISANDPYLPELDEAIIRLIQEYGKEVVRSAINHAIQNERSKKAASPSAYLMAELESGCRRLKNINERTDDYLEFLDTLR